MKSEFQEDNARQITLGQLIERLNQFPDKSLPVWVFDEQDQAYKSVIKVEQGNYDGEKTCDIFVDVVTKKSRLYRRTERRNDASSEKRTSASKS